MARRTSAVVPGRAAAEGALPQVCVITGQPADSILGVIFRWVPGWTWILLPFGVLPFLIVRAFTAVKIECVVPVTEQTGMTYRSARRWGWWSVLLGIVGIFAALLVESPALGIAAGVAILIGSCIYVWAIAWFIDVEPADQDGYIVLRRVHPNFGDAARGMAA